MRYILPTCLLCLLAGLPAFAQDADYTVIVNRILHFEDPNCDDGVLQGAEEYTALVWASDNIDTNLVGGNCYAITVAGDAIDVRNNIISIQSNTAATNIAIRLEAWEDDAGSRCTFDSGDDCALISQVAAIPFRSGPRNVLQSYGPFGSASSHQVFIDILWSFTAPSIPTALTATANNVDGTVSLTWEPSANATGYDLYRGTNISHAGESLVGSSLTTNFLDTTVTEGTAYFYWVKATNPDGDSDYSAEAAVTYLGPAGSLTDWQPLFPLGSLVYYRELLAPESLPAFGNNDEIPIELEAGDLLTIRVAPDGDLQTDIFLKNPSGANIATGTGANPGMPVLLTNVPLAVSGTYTMIIQNANGITGEYTLECLLNADFEQEFLGQGPNDDPLTAQDLDFLPVDNTAGHKASVFGDYSPLLLFAEDFETLPGSFSIDNNFGSSNGLWHVSDGRRSDGLGNHSPTGSLYYGQGEGSIGNGTYNVGVTGGAATSSPTWRTLSLASTTSSYRAGLTP